MSAERQKESAVRAAPIAGSARSPITEVITSDTGASLRRIRKLRVTIVDSPEPKERDRSYVFAQDEVRVGSGADADVPLSDSAVSREHLAIRLGPHGFSLSDTGSTNGSFVGDLRIERVSFTADTIVRIGKSIVKIEALAETVEQEISPRASFGRMLGISPAMRETFALLEKVSPSDLTVLIEGETGTGKELAAEGIHEASRRPGECIAVNCGAIPRELLESELFGHEKGAFTGAVRERAGAFVAAEGGTLFLDEVGELPLDMQAKLLRALERREVKAVGSDKTRSINVRIVAATNRSLSREVNAGKFRQDLYYRLAVVIVRIPPLRTRLEDLRLYVDHIQDELMRRRRAAGLMPFSRLDEAAMAMLMRYDFPGNVRELRNIVERWAVLGASSPPGDPSGIAKSGGEQAPKGNTHPAAHGTEISQNEGHFDTSLLSLPYHEAKDAWVERFEKAYAEAILKNSGGNVSKAARDAGIDRRHLQRLMARFGLRGGTD